MSNVGKVTVSLSAELLERIEDRRHKAGKNRSEMVTDLLWRGERQVEAEERAERAQAAYAAQPETDEERALADAAATDLFSEDAGWTKGRAPSKPRRVRTRSPHATR
jgi:metal-responsive CopG/Arc/MetJ family transcriptional regulator